MPEKFNKPRGTGRKMLVETFTGMKTLINQMRFRKEISDKDEKIKTQKRLIYLFLLMIAIMAAVLLIYYYLMK